MKHLIMDGPKCLLYSAAMVLGVTPETIVYHLGHDGTAIVDPNAVGNHRLRGIHIQEIVDFTISMGRNLQYIQVMPVLTQEESDVRTVIYSVDKAMGRFIRLTKESNAIIIGHNQAGTGHAVAWDGNLILDPVGKTYPLIDFGIREAWILI